MQIPMFNIVKHQVGGKKRIKTMVYVHSVSQQTVVKTCHHSCGVRTVTNVVDALR